MSVSTWISEQPVDTQFKPVGQLLLKKSLL